jgi:hypothetical protein
MGPCQPRPQHCHAHEEVRQPSREEQQERDEVARVNLEGARAACMSNPVRDGVQDQCRKRADAATREEGNADRAENTTPGAEPPQSRMHRSTQQAVVRIGSHGRAVAQPFVCKSAPAVAYRPFENTCGRWCTP